MRRKGPFLYVLEEEVPTLAKQMVESLAAQGRDIYLINALEIMSLSYARRETQDLKPRTYPCRI